MQIFPDLYGFLYFSDLRIHMHLKMALKSKSNPKVKILWSFTHPHDIPGVNNFISSLEQK